MIIVSISLRLFVILIILREFRKKKKGDSKGLQIITYSVCTCTFSVPDKSSDNAGGCDVFLQHRAPRLLTFSYVIVLEKRSISTVVKVTDQGHSIELFLLYTKDERRT